MQLTISIFGLLSSLVLANPLPDADSTSDRASPDAVNAETCSILGTGVNCRYHANTGSTIEHVFNGGSAYFTCNSYGECISGNW
jgi:hypothetical protein